MSTIYSYNGDLYEKKNPFLKAQEGFILSTLVSSAILSPLGYIGKPFEKQLIKEEINNKVYKGCLDKAFKTSGLADKGLIIEEAQYLSDITSQYVRGKNACFLPNENRILINTDKISIAGFHELGHALNVLKSKFGTKYLAKMRKSGYVIAALMEYVALSSRHKPKDAPKNLGDKIEDKCGLITFIAMLPIVIEEAIASHRGIKLARKAELAEPFIKNLKKLYTKALATYAGRAVLGALAVAATRKIMDYYTRPKKVDLSDLFKDD